MKRSGFFFVLYLDGPDLEWLQDSRTREGSFMQTGKCLAR